MVQRDDDEKDVTGLLHIIYKLLRIFIDHRFVF